jgi:hypothetical protein
MPSTATSILDGLSTSVAVKAPCRTVATSNITLSGLQTISGYTTAEGDRVLVKGQTNAVDNGIYSASTGSWTRTKDADGNRDLVQGTRVLVRSSTIVGVEYELTTANPIVIGTTALTFELRYGANATYDQTEAEITAGVTPSDDTIPSHTIVGVVYPQRYGFSTSASAAANVLSLQAAIDVAEAAQTLKTYSDDGYGANTYTSPEVHVPPGLFSINADIVLPEAIVIRGDKTILNQTVAAQDHLTSANPYRIDIEGIAFKGGKCAFNAAGPNTNTSRIRFNRCEFHTANASNYAITVDVTTLNMCIDDCLVMDSPLFLDTDGDYIEINNCWVNGYLRSTGQKPANTASVNNQSRHMVVNGGSWVPEEDGIGATVGTRWFSNRGGMLTLNDVQFGGENAGLPIVYEFGNSVSASSPFSTISGVIIRGGQLAQGSSGRADRGVVVLQETVPSIIDIRGGTYVVDGKLISDAGFTSGTLQDWLTSNTTASTPRFGITIDNVGEHGATFIPAALVPYACIRKRSIGTHPGYNALGPVNEPIVEYYPHTGNIQSRVVGNVSGRKSNPASTTYFDAITVTKDVNAANGSAAAVVMIDAVAVGEVSGPAGFVSQAQFRITFLSTRSGNILSTVETVTQNNKDSSGGTSVGNVLTCQVTGTSTTTVTIQLRINTTITAGTATVTWSGRMVSGANINGSDTGRVFTMVSA